MSSDTLLIYGANGYTGSLVARTAVRQGLHPILAGRSPIRVAPLAAELGAGLPHLRPGRYRSGRSGAGRRCRCVELRWPLFAYRHAEG